LTTRFPDDFISQLEKYNVYSTVSVNTNGATNAVAKKISKPTGVVT
jgi:hypothetical protein